MTRLVALDGSLMPRWRVAGLLERLRTEMLVDVKSVVASGCHEMV